MRATLLHNPKAGARDTAEHEVLTELRKAGYVSIHQGRVKDKHILDYATDLIVIAGGDGSVRKVALQLPDKTVPIGILPVGTANNIARTLGISGSPASIIQGWEGKHVKKFNTGLMRGPGGEKSFVESVGFGLFTNLMARFDEAKKEKLLVFDTPQQEIRQALESLIRLAEQYEPRACRMAIDEEEIQADLLMVEVMNIQSFGPNLKLAPEADPGDDLFDLVWVTESDRAAFIRYLESLLTGEDCPPTFSTRQGKQFGILWKGQKFHVDDQLQWKDKKERVDISLHPESLRFMIK